MCGGGSREIPYGVFARTRHVAGLFILLGKRWTSLTVHEGSTSLYEKLGTPGSSEWGSPEGKDIDEKSRLAPLGVTCVPSFQLESDDTPSPVDCTSRDGERLSPRRHRPQ